jgi:hypothetical protein
VCTVRVGRARHAVEDRFKKEEEERKKDDKNKDVEVKKEKVEGII